MRRNLTLSDLDIFREFALMMGAVESKSEGAEFNLASVGP
jgi:hypothetical protein